MSGDWTGRSLVLLTWSLMIFANYVTVSRIFNHWFISSTSWTGYTRWGSFFFILYEVLNFVALLCHGRAVFGNPGTTTKYVSKDAPEGFKNPRICKPCGFRWKPPRAHHCRKCQKCIHLMDHHCSWIDNCIGMANQKFFILFLGYSAILCGYQLFLLILSIILWVIDASLSISFIPSFLGLCVLLESITFLYMTTDFLSEQMDALETNSTLVESHQHTHGAQKDLWTHVAKVFGRSWGYWLLPVLPDLDLDFTEPVFLDKAVADQLRSRQRMLLQQKERYHEYYESNPGGGDGRPHHPTRVRHPQSANKRSSLLDSVGRDMRGGIIQKVADNESEFVSNSGAYTDLLQRHRPQHQSSASGQQLRHRGQRYGNGGHQEFVDDGEFGSGGSGSEVGSSSLYPDDEDGHGTDGDFSDVSHDEDFGSDEQFKNIYIKPWTDIGVELGNDQSKFIRLEDLEETEDEEEDDDDLEHSQSNQSAEQRFGPESSLSQYTDDEVHNRRDSFVASFESKNPYQDSHHQIQLCDSSTSPTKTPSGMAQIESDVD